MSGFSPTPEPLGMVNALLRQLADDSDSGVVRTLEDYMSLFPGFEEMVGQVLANVSERGVRDPSATGATDEDVSSETPVQVLGHYRLLREIGRGGQGIVWLAEDTRLRRRVALKTLRGARFADAAARQRFEREARVASSLDETGICTVYEVGETDGQAWIAMRFLDGEPLAARLRRLPRPLDRAEVEARARIVEGVARSLHAAHEAGIVHRDLKPGNVILTKDDTPVIVDFGLARSGTETLTAPSDVLGTPAYMAPERLDPEGMAETGSASDVWSLGVVLYEAVCGRRPFEGPTNEALIGAITNREPVSPKACHPAVSNDLSTVILTALAKAPDERYRTAAALADDLDAACHGRPILARHIGPLGRTVRWARREPAKALLILGLLVALLGSAVFFTAWVKDRPAIEAARHAGLDGEKELILSQASFELAEGDPLRALALFENVLGMEGRSPEAVAGVVLADLRLNHPESALQSLDTHANLLGQGPLPVLLRADVLRALGRAKDAAEMEQSSPPPRNALDHYLLAQRELQRGEGGDHAAFARSWRHATRAIYLSSGPRLLFFELGAHAAGHARDRDAALDMAATLRTRWPESATAHFFAGFALAQLKDASVRDEAIAAFRECIRIRPDDKKAYMNLGRSLRDKGLLDEAIAAFRAAIRVDPQWSAAYTELGLSLKDKGMLDDAIAAYNEAIRIDPNNAGSHSLLGNAFKAKGLLDEAIASCLRAVDIDPTIAHFHSNLGNALGSKGLLDRAITAHRKAIELKPEYARPYANLAGVLRAKGLLDLAIENYRRAIDLDQTIAGFHANLGDVLYEKGLLDEAMEARRKAAELRSK